MTAYTIEGDPTTWNFLVENDSKGKWRVRAKYDSIFAALRKPNEKPKHETGELDYYVVVRIDAKTDQLIPVAEKRSPESYKLRLENKDGPKYFVW